MMRTISLLSKTRVVCTLSRLVRWGGHRQEVWVGAGVVCVMGCFAVPLCVTAGRMRESDWLRREVVGVGGRTRVEGERARRGAELTGFGGLASGGNRTEAWVSEVV